MVFRLRRLRLINSRYCKYLAWIIDQSGIQGSWSRAKRCHRRESFTNGREMTITLKRFTTYAAETAVSFIWGKMFLWRLTKSLLCKDTFVKECVVMSCYYDIMVTWPGLWTRWCHNAFRMISAWWWSFHYVNKCDSTKLNIDKVFLSGLKLQIGWVSQRLTDSTCRTFKRFFWVWNKLSFISCLFSTKSHLGTSLTVEVNGARLPEGLKAETSLSKCINVV